MDLLAQRRCTATSKRSGLRCGNAPIPGGTVCVFHGGRAPLVQYEAKLRLAAMVEPAFDILLRALNVGVCPECGRPADMPLAVRAAMAVLDRAGFGPRASLSVDLPPGATPIEEAPPTPESLFAFMTEDEAHEVTRILTLAAQRRRTAPAVPVRVAVIDAEVVTANE